jgi:hypothetical protein
LVGVPFTVSYESTSLVSKGGTVLNAVALLRE